MSASSHGSKEKLRQVLREKASTHGVEEQAIASAKICAHIKAHPLWQSSKSVLFFWPMANEPDLRTLCNEALQAGKVVAFPKYFADSRSYSSVAIRNLEQDMAAGRFGIPEPALSSPELLLKVLDLILVPGLAFSFDGVRLGRGKGYYDRLLSQIAGTRCGVGYDWQIADSLPNEPHDIRLDCLVTPARWHDITTGPENEFIG